VGVTAGFLGSAACRAHSRPKWERQAEKKPGGGGRNNGSVFFARPMVCKAASPPPDVMV